MIYKVDYTPEAEKDMDVLDNSQYMRVMKAIERVSVNPLPKNEGGYGEPLGNKHGNNLTGYCKIKLKKLGIRVIYKVVKVDGVMKIIVVAARTDNEAYSIAAKRIEEF